MTLLKRSYGSWLADLLVVGVIALWAFSTRSLPDYVLPGPLPVARRFVELFVDPVFLYHTLASTLRVFASVLVALAIGGGLAILHRAFPVLDWVMRGGVQPFLSSFPSIGWAILAAIWFPPGHFAIIFVQVAILIPFCMINLAEGLRQIDREVMEMAQSFTRSKPRVAYRIMLPLLAPYLLGSLRISYGIGWKISLVAELLGSTSGLGYLMLRAQGSADLTTVLAACLAIVSLFIAGERLLLDPLARKFEARQAKG